MATSTEPSLPKLLASLGLGARSVNSLPLTRETNNVDSTSDGSNNDDGDDAAEDDEFSFLMSLPEFSSLNNEACQSLTGLLREALECIGTPDDGNEASVAAVSSTADMLEIDDPELWEKCADACDVLYDRVSAYIANEQRKKDRGGPPESLDTLSTAIGNASARARTNATGSYTRMIQGLADMEKPQNVYQGFVTQPVQNSREEPFTPTIVYDGMKQARLDGGEYTVEGHGLDTRYDNGGDNNEEKKDFTRRKYTSDMIASSHHYDHPYREEIESLEYRPWQLDATAIAKVQDGTIGQHINKNDQGIWISNEDDLEKLCARITEGNENGEIQEISLDLEAHSHRTFAGFVCLIQLSIRRPSPSTSKDTSSSRDADISTGYDFLIDALSLRHIIPAHLGPILANPSLLKVMHGADSDIPWLQRDFGCYVVNLFDTGRASRALKYISAGLAYLLRKYAGFEADKAHQLSDWRRRPLPEDMRGYAVSDTRYLLDIYDQLRLELDGHSSPDVSITQVLDRSKQVCLIRYDKEPFRPSGYLAIMDGGRKARRNKNKSSKQVTSEMSTQQEVALKALYDWRDRTARKEDESVQYVCPNSALVRIASNRPMTVAALQRLVNPLPPLVMRRSHEILDAIKSLTVESSKGEEKVAKKDNVSKPTIPSPTRNREMLSPILGSEALYQQAGWMTPTIPTSGESEDDDGVRKFLDVNSTNKGYSSTKQSSHGIEMIMSPPPLENEEEKVSRGASTDGLGTARAALGGSDDGEASAKNTLDVAQKSAKLIEKEMKKSSCEEAKKFGNGFSLIDLIRPIPLSESVDYEKEEENDGDSTNPGAAAPKDEEEEDKMPIPRSMREIYSLSNANRRRTGKDKTTKPLGLPESNTKNVEKMKEDDIDGAEAVIASSGGPGGYFGNTGKRQKTAPGKEGDIKLMTKMGWVKDKKDAESLAVVSGDGLSTGEKDTKHGGGTPHHKKASASGGKGGGGGGASGSLDYYSSMGAGMGAFDPNAAPSKNPFFGGAATSAASMLHGESNKGKPNNKRNKKR